MKSAILSTILSIVLLSLPLAAGELNPVKQTDATQKNETTQEEGRLIFELDLDAYYTNAGLIFSLTDEPIPSAGEQSELEVYRTLFKSSYLPRHVVLEASVNPMPCLGVLIKKNMENFYESSNLGDDVNLVKVITAGFEEPYAVSVFMGNVVSFKKPGEKRVAGNHGYMGYLFSMGDTHIKNNELVDDDWYELEWKIKGDRKYRLQKLSWSFRVGLKAHDNPEITDVHYLSLRRSRIDYQASANDLLKNSGFEYTFDMDKETLDAIRHEISIEKKWPSKKKRYVFTLGVGLIWEANRKYRGALREEGVDNYQVFIRPNLQF